MTKRSTVAQESRPSPAIIWDAIWAFGRTRILHAAVETKIFDYVAAGKATAADIARAAKLNERGVRILADALVGMELLEKKRDSYALTPTSRTFLVSESPAYMGHMVAHASDLGETWNNLAETVRTGKPGQSVEQEQRAREFFPQLVTALFPGSYGASNMAREALPERARKRVRDVLDVASGSAAWSLAWAVANPEVRVTAVDFGEIHDVGRRFTDRFGVTDRYEFVDGNIRKVNFGKGKYDLVILGHICHSEGAKHSQRLIKKSADALREGGMLLIAEMIPNDKRTGPLLPLMFGVNMLVNTDEGDVFTLAEYREWMKAAGLSAVRRLDFGPDGPGIIVGQKSVAGSQ